MLGCDNNESLTNFILLFTRRKFIKNELFCRKITKTQKGCKKSCQMWQRWPDLTNNVTAWLEQWRKITWIQKSDLRLLSQRPWHGKGDILPDCVFFDIFDNLMLKLQSQNLND